VYRDRLWEGADLAALGVASFGHINGVHMQNLDTWEAYEQALDEGRLPLGRAYRPSAEERLIRELVLQLKRGRIRPGYFAEKFGVDVSQQFDGQWRELQRQGYLGERSADWIYLSRDGLLRVDMLLPLFFRAEHRHVRYT
jgi:oxygen-independent coproporphyrinogen-3 oxidase